MNLSSDDLKSISAAVDRPVDGAGASPSVEQLRSGNNRVLKVRCDVERVFLVKISPTIEGDTRDRSGVEFGALSFMKLHGIGTVPHPLYMDRGGRFAVYEYVEGAPVDVSSVDPETIDRVVAFAAALKSLSRRRGAEALQAASEACLLIDTYLDCIRRRLARFESIADAGALHAEVATFIKDELIGEFQDRERQVLARPDRHSLALQAEQRTLSPSDFGFHNALKKPDGSLVFVDFEYFGWDDPAKLVSDFLHHPRHIDLSDASREHFLLSMLELFSPDATLEPRWRLVHPLVGLKWCLILLNEFLPRVLQRRRLANTELDVEATLAGQLDKARKKLEEVRALDP